MKLASWLTLRAVLLLAAAASLTQLTACAMKRGNVQPEQVCPTPQAPPAKPVAAMRMVDLPEPRPLAGLPPEEQAQAAVADYTEAAGVVAELRTKLAELINWIERR